MKHVLLATALAALAALSTLTADAALITWGAAQNIAGDSDVSTDGTLVGAVNIGFGSSIPSPTVNGVTFTGISFFNGSSGALSIAGANSFMNYTLPVGPVSSLSAPYQDLLRGGPTGSNFRLTLAGLIVGDTYAFQFWSSNSTGSAISSLTASTGASSVSLRSNPTAIQGGLGQYALGTFVADSSSQVISFASASLGVLNGAQLRNITPPAVPEPGTALAGVMVAGLLGLRRRRRN